jgi:hypothetical protein
VMMCYDIAWAVILVNIQEKVVRHLTASEVVVALHLDDSLRVVQCR